MCSGCYDCIKPKQKRCCHEPDDTTRQKCECDPFMYVDTYCDEAFLLPTSKEHFGKYLSFLVANKIYKLSRCYFTGPPNENLTFIDTIDFLIDDTSKYEEEEPLEKSGDELEPKLPVKGPFKKSGNETPEPKRPVEESDDELPVEESDDKPLEFKSQLGELVNEFDEEISEFELPVEDQLEESDDTLPESPVKKVCKRRCVKK